MARLTEIIVAIEATGVSAVLAALKQVDGAQAKIVDSSKSSGAAQKGANEAATLSWSQLATGINQSIGIINTAINLGKQAYNFTEEGAQLEYAATKFDRLATAAGTTADVLLKDLKEATRGMVSDAELMGSAGDFMALGLAKSHDEVVRLTNVAGALGMNMNQLVLTLTNKTTMRFDALGVAVDGFKEKVAALEATGMSADDAFNEAFLQQAEAQIQKVGHVADTTAGKFKHLEGAIGNLFDGFKMDAADAVADAIEGLAVAFDNRVATQNINELKGSLGELGLSAKEIKTIMGGKGFYLFDEDTLAKDSKIAIDSMEMYKKQYKYLVDDMGVSSEAAIDRLNTMYEDYGRMNVTYAGDMTQAWADANDRVYEDFSTTSDDMRTTSIADIAEMRASVVSLQGDWKAMSTMATNYDTVLTAITDNTEDMDQLKAIIAGTSKEFDGVAMSVKDAQTNLDLLIAKGKTLEEAFAQIGANMTFQMLQATMAIGGYTESEITALTDFMVENSMISTTAADAMKVNYKSAIDQANALQINTKIGEIIAKYDDYENGIEISNGLILDAKTGEVLADIRPYLAELLAIPDPDDKTVEIIAKYTDPGFVPNVPAWVNIGVNYIDGGYGPKPPTALGGPVYPGQVRTWNEPGREGEMLIPSEYGRVMSNHEVAQAIRDAQSMTEGIGGNTNTSNTTNHNVTYQVNSPQYKNEPVLTLSEHLRILSTLEGM